VLEAILGSKSAERVLLFLLVNQCCYASEIQKIHGIALTPLQSILCKLEKAGVITFEMRGKAKVYRFNPSYPLLDELKALLKKAFVRLPPEEKKVLFSRKEQWPFFAKDQFTKEKRKALHLEAFWQRLSKVQRISIQTQSGLEGVGDVTVETSQGVLIFKEKGQWAYSTQGVDFSNVLRWSLDRSSQMIALEHLRYGPTQPVFLFHLAPTGPKSLQSIDSHFCADDCYFGRIDFHDQHVRFLWRILGPQKNEVLYYTYQ
jgi:hypothetical protein